MTFGSEPQATHQPPGTAPAPRPVWALPERPIQWRQTEPLEYHQLLRGAAKYRWWKPLVALVLGVLYFFTLSFIFSLMVLPLIAIAAGGDLTQLSVDDIVSLDTQNPASLFVALGSVALMLPSALLAMLSVGLGTPKRMWSVALRIRWRWIGRTVLPALATLVIMHVVGIGLSILIAGGLGEMPEPTGDETLLPADYNITFALISLAIVLVLVPLQATAEELVFRGALMQSIGAWCSSASSRTAFGRVLRSPWIAILVPSVGFALMHIYNIWGLLSVGVMGVVCAWLTWRTGGLEAAITIHVINNLFVFMLMIAAFGGDTGQESDSGGLGSLIGSAAGLVFYAWWVDRDFRRKDGRRTRIDYVQVRYPVIAPATGAAA